MKSCEVEVLKPTRYIEKTPDPICEDRLEAALIKYVDGFSLDDLKDWVSNDLWAYYSKSATDEETATFIQEVEEK